MSLKGVVRRAEINGCLLTSLTCRLLNRLLSEIIFSHNTHIGDAGRDIVTSETYNYTHTPPPVFNSMWKK